MATELEIRKEQKSKLFMLMRIKSEHNGEIVNHYITALKVEMDAADIAHVEKMINESQA